MKRGPVFCLALSVMGALFMSGQAHAFEREWHTGGGIGVTAYPHYYAVGPAFGLNAGYGISDVFDLKLEVLGSYHGYSAAPKGDSPWAAPFSVAGGLSYKLDVLQWIPYAAVLVGFQDVSGTIPRGASFHRADALAALVLGVDYAMTRNFGLGASVRTDMRITSPTDGESVTTMLRAEYHWGF